MVAMKIFALSDYNLMPYSRIDLLIRLSLPYGHVLSTLENLNRSYPKCVSQYEKF